MAMRHGPCFVQGHANLELPEKLRFSQWTVNLENASCFALRNKHCRNACRQRRDGPAFRHLYRVASVRDYLLATGTDAPACRRAGPARTGCGFCRNSAAQIWYLLQMQFG